MRDFKINIAIAIGYFVSGLIYTCISYSGLAIEEMKNKYNYIVIFCLSFLVILRILSMCYEIKTQTYGEYKIFTV